MLKETITQKLLVFERKILRRIFGSTKENQIWRIKTIEELDKLIKHKTIVNCIKAQKLSWFGHVQRMPDTRTAKKIFKWKPLTKNHKEDPSTDGRIISNRIQHFIFQLMRTTLKNVELLKHFKIRKTAPTCFRFTRKPSSGSHSQYLAKITHLVQSGYVEFV